MIELFGIGMPARQGRWHFRGVSLRVETAELIAVVSPHQDARLAFLDAVSARRIPIEGRVWVNGLPLTKDTQDRLRTRVVEVDLHAGLVENRSLLWNVQVGQTRRLWTLEHWRRRLSAHSRLDSQRALARVGLERLASERVSVVPPSVRRRALIARALVSQPEVLVIREIEHQLSLSDAANVLAAVGVLVVSDRITVLVSTADPVLLQMFAERVLAIAEGHLHFNGSPSGIAGTADRVARHALQQADEARAPPLSRRSSRMRQSSSRYARARGFRRQTTP